ncbi:helix-turn-helix domain-containing protein [Rhizobium sp. SG2393]|uniref:helix-turn-helix domain-containing protein n=1 Tax=Rhizobium sp. SG2393 TaxID=3276279 RepID=UPI0036721DC4
MGDIQKLVIDGKSYVLLSEDDYEDLIDGLQADAIMARVDAGEETWPFEVVQAKANGENPVRVYRQYRKMTTTELAAAAGISQPYLSDIETGKKPGSVAVLLRIARALKVDLDDLVFEVEPD